MEWVRLGPQHATTIPDPYYTPLATAYGDAHGSIRLIERLVAASPQRRKGFESAGSLSTISMDDRA